jgi:glucokinase
LTSKDKPFKKNLTTSLMKNLAVGVDIGGSHISCAVCDLSEKKILHETIAEFEVNNKGTSDEIIKTWSEALKQSIKAIGIEKINGIGFAMPGPFDYINGISLMTNTNDKYETLYGVNISQAIRSAIGLSENFPVRFINDATAFAIGEARFGKAKGYNRILSVTLGTGFGSAFICNSLPVISGENVPLGGCVWHLPFEDGIADDYFSTRGFQKRYMKINGTHISGVRELALLAKHNVKAQELFSDFGNQLGNFLAPWLKKFDAEILVIGGNISNAYPLFETELKAKLNQTGNAIPVAVSELKETASILGSAILTDDHFHEKLKPLLLQM